MTEIEPAEDRTKAERKSPELWYVQAQDRPNAGNSSAYVDTEERANYYAKLFMDTGYMTVTIHQPVVPAPIATNAGRYCVRCKLNVQLAPDCTNCGGDTVTHTESQGLPVSTEQKVSDATLAAHGLRSMGEQPTIAKLREMAAAFVAAADDAESAFAPFVGAE